MYKIHKKRTRFCERFLKIFFIMILNHFRFAIKIRISIEKDKSEPISNREKVRIIFAWCTTKSSILSGFLYFQRKNNCWQTRNLCTFSIVLFAQMIYTPVTGTRAFHGVWFLDMQT